MWWDPVIAALRSCRGLLQLLCRSFGHTRGSPLRSGRRRPRGELTGLAVESPRAADRARRGGRSTVVASANGRPPLAGAGGRSRDRGAPPKVAGGSPRSDSATRRFASSWSTPDPAWSPPPCRPLTRHRALSNLVYRNLGRWNRPARPARPHRRGIRRYELTEDSRPPHPLFCSTGAVDDLYFEPGSRISQGPLAESPPPASRPLAPAGSDRPVGSARRGER